MGNQGEDGCCYSAKEGEVITIDSSPVSSDRSCHRQAFQTVNGRGVKTALPHLDEFTQSLQNGKRPNGLQSPEEDSEAMKVLQAQQRVPPANFSGSWRCEKVAGNMEAFLIDMGLGDMLRKAAATANYGAGVQVQNIIQLGDFFEVENILRTPVTMQFRVGEGEQRTVDQVGKPIVVDPRWEGPALIVASRRESGEPVADSKRYYDGNSMVIQFTSPQGTVVERIFARTS